MLHSITRFNRVRTTLMLCATLAGGTLLAGCQSDAQTGALVGSGIGAGLGAIIGHQSGHGGEGALIGAGIGALGGYAVGNENDKKRHGYYGHGGCNYDY